MKINNIKNEIESLKNRRSAIEIDRQKAVAKLDIQKQSVITGGGNVSTVQTASVELIALDNLIQEINSRIETFQTDLETLQAIEEREQKIAKIMKLDAHSEPSAQRLERLFVEFNTFVAEWSKEASTVFFGLEENQRLYWQSFQELVPSVQSTLRRDLPETELEIENLLAELKARGAKLAALQSEEFNKWFVHRLRDQLEGFKLPETRFSGTARFILQGLSKEDLG